MGNLISYILPTQWIKGHLCCKKDSVLICGKGIDDINRPVQQDNHGTVSILPNASAYCQSGQLFTITRSQALDFPNFTDVDYAFENPPDNTKTMYLENITGGMGIVQAAMPRSYQDTVSIGIDEATFPTGTVITPSNRNLGSTNTSTLVVSQNPDRLQINYGNRLFTSYYPSGEFSINFHGQIIVPPGHSIICFLNTNIERGTTGSLLTTFTWFEL